MDEKAKEEAKEKWGKSKERNAKVTQVEILPLCLCELCVDAEPALSDKEEEIYHLSVVPCTLTERQCENPPDTHT